VHEKRPAQSVLVGTALAKSRNVAQLDTSHRDTAPILVADGERDSRAAVIWCLLAEGYRVVPVSDGIAAAAALERPPLPAAAVIDLGLQGFSGRRLIEHLRSSPRLQAIPIIAIDLTEPYAPLPAGVAFLRKPCDGDLLLARLRQMGRDNLKSFFPSRQPGLGSGSTPSPEPWYRPDPHASFERDDPPSWRGNDASRAARNK
jgi:CheY-like chemotaxis protein